MPKTKTTYICQNCGFETAKWMGKCQSCGEWNTIVEEVSLVRKKTASKPSGRVSGKPVSLSEISVDKKERLRTGINEFDRILGGGIVPGSVVLVGGEPGIGKSTLALQFAMKDHQSRVLYISGEESEQQIKIRANRLGDSNSECLFLCETVLENIELHIEQVRPDVVIIDSIQTIYLDSLDSSPGSVSQVREGATYIMKLAKKMAISVIVIGHINKEGNLAGPKVLEHIVDTVLLFEGDMNHFYRILRVTKNRFGATSEMAIFEMNQQGLHEVLNPSDILITQSDENLSGVSVAATIDGLRPFLIEVQALVSSAVYGTPQRSATGYDIRRLNMLLAVLEKRAGFKLAVKDVFLNIAGGIKVNDPAIDLAVVVSVLSSSVDMAVNKKDCFAAEIGLSGEVRPVNRIVQRIREAEKMGFERVFISKYNKKNLRNEKFHVTIELIGKIDELVKRTFRTVS
jgi:DNA repair protein RadA/Sms